MNTPEDRPRPVNQAPTERVSELTIETLKAIIKLRKNADDIMSEDNATLYKQNKTTVDGDGNVLPADSFKTDFLKAIKETGKDFDVKELISELNKFKGDRTRLLEATLDKYVNPIETRRPENARKLGRPSKADQLDLLRDAFERNAPKDEVEMMTVRRNRQTNLHESDSMSGDEAAAVLNPEAPVVVNPVEPITAVPKGYEVRPVVRSTSAPVAPPPLPERNRVTRSASASDAAALTTDTKPVIPPRRVASKPAVQQGPPTPPRRSASQTANIGASSETVKKRSRLARFFSYINPFNIRIRNPFNKRNKVAITQGLPPESIPMEANPMRQVEPQEERPKGRFLDPFSNALDMDVLSDSQRLAEAAQAGFTGKEITPIPEATPTPEVKAIPQEQSTTASADFADKEITPIPEATPTPEVKAIPGATPTPTPEATPTPEVDSSLYAKVVKVPAPELPDREYLKTRAAKKAAAEKAEAEKAAAEKAAAEKAAAEKVAADLEKRIELLKPIVAAEKAILNTPEGSPKRLGAELELEGLKGALKQASLSLFNEAFPKSNEIVYAEIVHEKDGKHTVTSPAATLLKQLQKKAGVAEDLSITESEALTAALANQGEPLLTAIDFDETAALAEELKGVPEEQRGAIITAFEADAARARASVSPPAQPDPDAPDAGQAVTREPSNGV